MQNKAPIRSQVIGPVTLGERQHPIDRSMQRQKMPIPARVRLE